MVKRRTFKKSLGLKRGRLMKRSRYSLNNYISKRVNRAIEFDIPIYLQYDPGVSTTPNYSFSPSVFSLTYTSVLNLLALDTEFLKLRTMYGYWRLKSFKLIIRRTVQNIVGTTVRLLTLPPISAHLDVASASTNAQNNWEQDTNLKLQISNSDSKPVTKFYRLPLHIGSYQGYNVGGTGVWYANGDIVGDQLLGRNSLCPILGYPRSPVLEGLTVPYASQVGDLSVTVYLEYGFPRNVTTA